MGPMETSALRSRKLPWDLDGKLAFILAIPVMNARGVHLDQYETSRFNAIVFAMLLAMRRASSIVSTLAMSASALVSRPCYWPKMLIPFFHVSVV